MLCRFVQRLFAEPLPRIGLYCRLAGQKDNLSPVQTASGNTSPGLTKHGQNSREGEQGQLAGLTTLLAENYRKTAQQSLNLG